MKKLLSYDLYGETENEAYLAILRDRIALEKLNEEQENVLLGILQDKFGQTLSQASFGEKIKQGRSKENEAGISSTAFLP